MDTLRIASLLDVVPPDDLIRVIPAVIMFGKSERDSADHPIINVCAGPKNESMNGRR